MPRVFEVARQTLLLQARGRLYITLVAFSALSGCVFFFAPWPADRWRGDEWFELSVYFLAFVFFLPFVTLFLAAQAVSGDIDDRTCVYLFTRPIRRVSLLIGKWLAVILLGGVFVTVGMTVLYLVIAFGGREWQYGRVPSAASFLVMLLAGWIAVVGYSAIGCLFATFFRRPMLIGVLYMLLEQGVSRLPAQVPIHTLTIAFPVRLFMYQTMDATDLLNEFLRATIPTDDGEEERLAVEGLLALDPLAALLKLAGFALLLALLIYSRREYDSRPQE